MIYLTIYHIRQYDIMDVQETARSMTMQTNIEFFNLTCQHEDAIKYKKTQI